MIASLLCEHNAIECDSVCVGVSAINRRLVCRLADFGLARLLPVRDWQAYGGTDPYGSPEQFVILEPGSDKKVSLGRKSLTELSLRFMFHHCWFAWIC